MSANNINESKGKSLLPKFLTNLFTAPAAAAPASRNNGVAPNIAQKLPNNAPSWMGKMMTNVLEPAPDADVDVGAALNPQAPEYVPMAQRPGLNPAAPEFIPASASASASPAPQSAGRRRRNARKSRRTLNKKRKASATRRRRDRRDRR